MDNRQPANDTERSTPEPPRLQSLDLGALGISAPASDALVCEIDDPDCEVTTPTPAPGRADREREEA